MNTPEFDLNGAVPGPKEMGVNTKGKNIIFVEKIFCSYAIRADSGTVNYNFFHINYSV